MSAVIDHLGEWASAEEILDTPEATPEPTNTANGSAFPFIPPPHSPPPPLPKPISNSKDLPPIPSSTPLIPVRRASQGPTLPQPSIDTNPAPRVAGFSAPRTPLYPPRQGSYGSIAPGGPSQPYQFPSSTPPQIFASPAPMSSYGSPAPIPYQSPAGPARLHSQRPSTVPQMPYGTYPVQPIPPPTQRPATAPSAPQTPASQSMYGTDPSGPQRTPGSQSMYGTSPVYPSSAPQPTSQHPYSYGAPIIPGAPHLPYSNLPPGVVVVPRPLARRKTDAFVANDPFRSHFHNKHERPSDDLTFDDIPVPGATVPYHRPTWGYAPPPVSVTPGHQRPQPPSSVPWRPRPSRYDPSQDPPMMSQQPPQSQPIYSRPSGATASPMPHDGSSQYPPGTVEQQMPYPIGDTTSRTSSPSPTSQPPMQLPSTVETTPLSTGSSPPSSSDHQEPILQPPEPSAEPLPRPEEGERPHSPISLPPSPPPRPEYLPYDPNDPSTFPPTPQIPIFSPYEPAYIPTPPPRPPRPPFDMFPIPMPHRYQSFWSRLFGNVANVFRWPFSRPQISSPKLEYQVPYPPMWGNPPPPPSSSTSEDSHKKRNYPSLITLFILITLPREIYLNFLLRLPSLYFSRVARIFEEADLSLPELKKMALQTAAAAQGKITSNSNSKMMQAEYVVQNFEKDSTKGGDLPLEYEMLKATWEAFIDSVMREWKTFNIISVLLLSAILTILQIQGAGNDPLTRTFAIFSLICALISLLFGCMYIIRFGSMRKTYKAAEWALEAKKSNMVWWNVWILLAMPVVWLTWSIMLYIACIMTFVWRTSASDTTPPADLSSRALLDVRIVITVVLGIGMIYGCLILHTFSRYGEAMDKAWKKRIDGWLEEQAATQIVIQPPSMVPSPYTMPYFDPYSQTQPQPQQFSSQYPMRYAENVPDYDYRPTTTYPTHPGPAPGPAPAPSPFYPPYPNYPPPETKLGYTGPEYGPAYANASYVPPPEPYDSPAPSPPPPREGSPESTSSTLYATTRMNTQYNKTPGLHREDSGSSGVYGYGVGVGAQQQQQQPTTTTTVPPPRLVPQNQKKIPLAVPPGPDLPPIPGTPMTGFTTRSSSSGGGSLRERDEDGDGNGDGDIYANDVDSNNNNNNNRPTGSTSTTSTRTNRISPRNHDAEDHDEADDDPSRVRFRSPLVSAQGSFSFAGSEAEEPLSRLSSLSPAQGAAEAEADAEASGSSFTSFNTARVSPEPGDESLRRRRPG